jgi:diguanylate cyclase (GGDEF)-like protein/PAS domain S-box-containing protein
MTLSCDLEARIRELEIENFRLRNEVDVLANPNSQNKSVAIVNLIEKENHLLERNHRFQTILDHIPAMIGYWDTDLLNRYGNKAYSSWFGIDPTQMQGKHIREIIGEERYRLNLPFIEGALRGEPQEFERAIRTPDGKQTRYSLAEYIPDIIDGKVLGFFVLVSDITSVKEAEAVIKSLAFYDTLTKLPNRRLFIDHLTQAMASSKRNSQYSAVMFLDMDNFKSLNDVHGHGAGDLLLTEASIRPKSCVREIDLVARFGGDEFVVLLNDLDTNKGKATSQAKIVAEKIRDSLSKPYHLTIKQYEEEYERVEHLCSTSIGGVLFRGQDVGKDDILRLADSYMFKAKKTGGNSVQFYESTT